MITSANMPPGIVHMAVLIPVGNDPDTGNVICDWATELQNRALALLQARELLERHGFKVSVKGL